MKKILFIAAVALALTGCDNRERLVKEAVKEVLTDPDSAKFSPHMSVTGKGAGLVACGMVNAKNRMGGYTGDSPFMIWGQSVYMGGEPGAITECCYSIVEEQEAGASQLSQEASRACARNRIGLGVPALVLFD